MPVTMSIGSDQHRGFSDTGMTLQVCFDLAGLDSVPPDLDLVIDAAQEIEREPVTQPTLLFGKLEPERKGCSHAHSSIQAINRVLLKRPMDICLADKVK